LAGIRPDRLLDAIGPLNIGRTVFVPMPNTLAENGLAGPEVKILQIPGLDILSQQITIHFFLNPVKLPSPPIPLARGPITGILLFGTSGTNFSRIEFDLPMPWTGGIRGNFFTLAADAMTVGRAQPNGVSVTVPGSGFIALARNDSRLFAIQEPAAIGDPVTVPIGVNIGAIPSPIPDPEVSAYISIYPAPTFPNRLTKTVMIVGNMSGAGATTPLAAAATSNRVGIPNYARRVSFPRTDAAAPPTIPSIAVTFLAPAPTGAVISGEIPLATGEQGDLLIPPWATGLEVRNTSAVAIDKMLAVFDLRT
jgi:hypothetical protein